MLILRELRRRGRRPGCGSRCPRRRSGSCRPRARAGRTRCCRRSGSSPGPGAGTEPRAPQTLTFIDHPAPLPRYLPTHLLGQKNIIAPSGRPRRRSAARSTSISCASPLNEWIVNCRGRGGPRAAPSSSAAPRRGSACRRRRTGRSRRPTPRPASAELLEGHAQQRARGLVVEDDAAVARRRGRQAWRGSSESSEPGSARAASGYPCSFSVSLVSAADSLTGALRVWRSAGVTDRTWRVPVRSQYGSPSALRPGRRPAAARRLVGAAAGRGARARAGRGAACWSCPTTTASGTRSWSALAIKPRRRLRFLARAPASGGSRGPWSARSSTGSGQIPIRRGAGDAKALEKAIEALRAGEAVCVFPEGGLSWGEELRARSGVARLAQWCPGVQIVLCTVEGATDYARFPRRPRVSVTFFARLRATRNPARSPPCLQLVSSARSEIASRPCRLGAGHSWVGPRACEGPAGATGSRASRS